MVNNQAPTPDPRNESDPQTHGIPESGSDVDEVRNEVPGASQPTGAPAREARQSDANTSAPDTSVREPGMGPDQDIEFDRNPVMNDNDSARPAKAGIAGMGMFFTAIIILIVAVIVILWFAL